MDYEGQICRAPMERSSFMLPVMVGCSYNQCKFCNLFRHLKYRELPIEQIEEELKRVRDLNGKPKKIFLGDGNAFGLKTEKLYEILDRIAYYFPECEGVNMDATVTSILHKSQEELEMLAAKKVKHLYLGIEGKLAAVICIEDPLRPEAPEVIKQLRKAGFTQIVMMTGDSDRTAKAIAARVGVDKYYSEVLPEDKAKFVEEAKAQGRKVLMVGDGINDSPALSAADVGIAISDGAELAREIADITIGADDLSVMVTLKEISNGLMDKIHKNYRRIVGINGSLIALGVTGVIQPTMSALLHNTSTLLIGMDSMKSVL